MTSIALTSLDYSTNLWQTKHANSYQKVFMLKVKHSLHNWHGSSECCWGWNANVKENMLDWCGTFWRVGARIIPKFPSEWRSVTLVTDNCPAHPHIKNLKLIKLFFLPTKTTSTSQRMDQGVTRSLKAKYCNNIV